MIDTRRLREETGYWAYDPAFGETGACRSAITYVDGDEGVLLYRCHRSLNSPRKWALKIP
jgi:citrate synthase